MPVSVASRVTSTRLGENVYVLRSLKTGYALSGRATSMATTLRPLHPYAMGFIDVGDAEMVAEHLHSETSIRLLDHYDRSRQELMSIASIVKCDPGSVALIPTFIECEDMYDFLNHPIYHQMNIGVVHGLYQDDTLHLLMEIQPFDAVSISTDAFRKKLMKTL